MSGDMGFYLAIDKHIGLCTFGQWRLTGWLQKLTHLTARGVTRQIMCDRPVYVELTIPMHIFLLVEVA